MGNAIGDVLWTPSRERVEASRMWQLMQRRGAGTYHDLWSWSVDDLESFWASVWDDCGVIASERYHSVLIEPQMPGARWFDGARLNFAENLLRGDGERLAIIASGEDRADDHVTLRDLRERVALARAGLVRLGVKQGDRVAGFLPNCVEAVVLMLATTSLGAIWSSCSPDFGPLGVVDRFGQIRPKVLCVADGYRYNGTTHSLEEKVRTVVAQIDAIEHVVRVEFAGVGHGDLGRSTVAYAELLSPGGAEAEFVQLPPDHPVYIMYSSGTTGVPKSIVHGAGGTLLQHLKEHQLHTDIRPGDVVFWFTTCGWMMWNWLVSALASEATIVLYDGSPTHPTVDVLWELAERVGVTHFGTSPKFLAANENAGARPTEIADLAAVRSVLSTGSPLNPEQFDWVYANVKQDVHLASVSGGTDLIGCFAGGAPVLPVRRGELQCRGLGMQVEAWDEEGTPVVGRKGELVCTKPFPSMPVGFWNDPAGRRYHDAYFAENPGVWTHGDYVEIRPSGGVIIHGRSDTTLNPGGVRIGTAEIYRAIEPMREIVDSIVVGRATDGDVEVVLCLQLADGVSFDEGLVERVRQRIRAETTPRHVPRHVFAVPDIPYTISGKKVEKAVRQMIEGERVENRDALANPEALDHYAELPFPSSASPTIS